MSYRTHILHPDRKRTLCGVWLHSNALKGTRTVGGFMTAAYQLIVCDDNVSCKRCIKAQEKGRDNAPT